MDEHDRLLGYLAYRDSNHPHKERGVWILFGIFALWCIGFWVYNQFNPPIDHVWELEKRTNPSSFKGSP